MFGPIRQRTSFYSRPWHRLQDNEIQPPRPHPGRQAPAAVPASAPAAVPASAPANSPASPTPRPSARPRPSPRPAPYLQPHHHHHSRTPEPLRLPRQPWVLAAGSGPPLQVHRCVRDAQRLLLVCLPGLSYTSLFLLASDLSYLNLSRSYLTPNYLLVP